MDELERFRVDTGVPLYVDDSGKLVLRQDGSDDDVVATASDLIGVIAGWRAAIAHPSAVRNCAQPDCRERRVGRSRYCEQHREEARRTAEQMISDRKAAISGRNEQYQRWTQSAFKAGVQAARVNGERADSRWMVRMQPANKAYPRWAMHASEAVSLKQLYDLPGAAFVSPANISNGRAWAEAVARYLQSRVRTITFDVENWPPT